MLKKFVSAFALLALAVVVATAGTVPGTHTYTITLIQPAVVNGTQLQPGEYRLSLEVTKVTLSHGKQTVELQAAKVETVDKKFDNTAIRYSGTNLSEIRIGGTKTRVIVTP
jgi:Cu/Ag efflux protein CusF